MHNIERKPRAKTGMLRTARKPTAPTAMKIEFQNSLRTLRPRLSWSTKRQSQNHRTRRTQDQNERHAAEIVADGRHGRLAPDHAEVPANEGPVEPGKGRKRRKCVARSDRRRGGRLGLRRRFRRSRASRLGLGEGRHARRTQAPGRARQPTGPWFDRRIVAVSRPSSPFLNPFRAAARPARYRMAAPFTSIPLINILSSSTLGEISNAAERLIMSFCRKA